MKRSKLANGLLWQIKVGKQGDVKIPMLQSGDILDQEWKHYVTCYLTLDECIRSCHEKINDLEDALREMEVNFIVAGDVNAKRVE